MIELSFLTGVLSSMFGEYWSAVIISVIITACAIISAFLKAPTESSGAMYRGFYTIVNMLAVNVFRAKNANSTEQEILRRTKILQDGRQNNK